MYPEMRRKDRALSLEQANNILEKGEYGILSTVGEDGQSYGIPLSYIVRDECIYFHCAKEGRKLKNLHHNKNVCFTVVGYTKPVYENNFSTYFESVVVFGAAGEVTDEAEKKRVLVALCEKYLPAHMDKAETDIQKSLPITAVYRIQIQHMTGKGKMK